MTTPTQVRCFICQRITAGVFDGKKDAFEKAGVWFQNQESWQRICWCPQCQRDLKEPEEAYQSWRSRDPRWKTERWMEVEGLTEDMVNGFMNGTPDKTKEGWIDPPGGPLLPRKLHEILEEERRHEEEERRHEEEERWAAPPPPPHGERPPASDANDPPGPPPGDGVESWRESDDEIRRIMLQSILVGR